MRKTPFHLVDQSPWPFLMGVGAFFTFSSFFFFFLYIKSYSMIFVIFVIMILFNWWRDVVRESTYMGFHTPMVKKNIYYGMILFIVSELFFFLGFFWTFMHSSLTLSVELNGVWPPVGINTFNPMGVPFLNTIVLLSSGFTITWSHYSFLKNMYNFGLIGIFYTVILGMLFTFLQGMEYMDCSYCMNDSVFGSIFFLGTGFHGLHVIIGTIFLIISMIRMYLGHFSVESHVGLECSIWYWHFVDVIWIFLYIMFYWWGGM
uniref:Cytochrome c oxidase subunit 3 n=1 Tax=Didemnum vexillum TaxID=516032 RepID=A0A0A7LHR1_9ASCI|nr:cytochrome c oxidase subunit III [Didemnum vexillum]